MKENKENIFENLQFALNFFNWSEKEKAKKKWFKLLEQAKNGDNDFIISQKAINEFDIYLNSFLKEDKQVLAKFEHNKTAIKRLQQIENYLKSYLCNYLEVRGQYNSFYNYKNYNLIRISDHFSVHKKYYIEINKKIYVGLQYLSEIKYACDTVIFIPNFFNANRKKQALLLILEKNLNLILEEIKKKGQIVTEDDKQIIKQSIKSKKYVNKFIKNYLNYFMASFKENLIELNKLKNINN